ncbi:MAG: hypothetical protein ABF651_00135 [Sporolactobacillus sp.]
MNALFSKPYLSSLIDAQRNKVKAKIESEDDDYILDIDETKYVNYLFNEFKVNPLFIQEDSIINTSEEKTEQRMRLNEYISVKTLFIYSTIPYAGDKAILEYRADHFSLSPPRADIFDDHIEIEIRVDKENPKRTTDEYNRTINEIKEYVGYGNKIVENFNNNLQFFIKDIFEAKKKHILKTMDILTKLEIPIQIDNNISKTFAVPTPSLRKKIEIARPKISEHIQNPEPVLNINIYKQILSTINDVGKQFERMPSTYHEKGEEDLRDHILMMLEPQFTGSATGETFNKNGKTDILLRYEGTNVFIGECKFWKGEKHYLDTISQLISYLTWRDSKAAVIIFDKQKNFSNAYDHIVEITQKHENYIEYKGLNDESWFDFIFHINGDKNKEIALAVMLYHIPENES